MKQRKAYGMTVRIDVKDEVLPGFNCKGERLVTTPQVAHIIVKKVKPGVFFVEVDFHGACLPVYSHSGGGDHTACLGFDSEYHDKEVPGSTEIEFKLPRSMQGASFIGEVTKRTWRGFLVSRKVFHGFYEKPKFLFDCLRDK